MIMVVVHAINTNCQFTNTPINIRYYSGRPQTKCKRIYFLNDSIEGRNGNKIIRNVH